MSNLLQKASIITTPTAYSEGKLHSVKPVKTFGSELVPSIATIVNASGGSITQISQNSYSSISEGASSSTVRPKFDFSTTSGKTYKLVITPIGTITGTVNFDFYDGSTYLFQNYDFTTTKEITFTDNGTVFGAFDGTQTYNISNFTISIKEVKDADFDFTRGSLLATRVNEQGLIESVEANLPRIDYTDGTGSLLLEPESTNLLPYSEDFSQLSTVTSGLGAVTETESFSEAPNGENEATRLQMSSVDGYALKGYTIPSFNDYFYVSVYLKSNTTENQEVAIYGRNSVTQSYTVTPKWQRFEVSCDSRSASSFFYFGARTSYGSDADIDILAWGVQAEQGTYATSYIPTSGSAVVRNADVCNNAGSSNLINSTEGVLYAEIAALANDLTNRVISLSDGTSDERVVLQYHNTTNRIRCFIKSGGSFYATLDKVVSDITDFHKIAYKYKSGETKLFVDGSLITSSSNTFSITGLNVLQFANGTPTASPFYGKVKSVAVFKEALTDEELKCLTKI